MAIINIINEFTVNDIKFGVYDLDKNMIIVSN